MDYKKYLDLNKYSKGIKIAGIACLLAILPGAILAQKPKVLNDGEIPDSQIIIEKDKKIEMPEAVRNFEKPPVQPKNQVRQIKPYKFDDFEATLSDIETKVKVLTAKQDDLKKLYGNYLKAGYGNYGTSYLEGFFNNKRNENYSFGGKVKHLASRYGHVDDENSGSSDNEVGIFGTYYNEYTSVSGRLDYNRERYNFYGYPNTDNPPDNSDIKQLFQTFSGKIQVDNNAKDSDVDYHVGISGSRLTDHYNASENEFGINLRGSYSLATASKILLNTELYLTKVEDSASVNRSFFKLTPHYQFTYKGFLLKLGANIIYENDKTPNSSNFHIFPSAEASYELIPEATVYAGVEGDVYRTSLRSFITENPYLRSNVSLRHTQKPLDIYGGFKGKVLSNLGYNVKISAASYKNLYYYMNSDDDQSKFNIQYDKSTFIFSYLAELGYSYSEKLTLGLRLEGFGYTLDNIGQHYHRPNYTGTFIGKYNLKEKISFTGEIFYINGLIARRANSGNPGINEELDDIIDLNLKVDYRFSSKFSAFVHANNLLGKNYQRYLYYPSRGFNILAGLSFSF